MSSSVYNRPLRLNLQPSRRLFSLILFNYGGAIFLLWLVPWWGSLKILFSLLLLGDGWRQCCRYVWYRSETAIKDLLWRESGAWEALGSAALRYPEIGLKHAFVHPWLVVLTFRNGKWRRTSVVILPDALDAETFRRLRVRLHLEAGNSTEQE